MLSLAARRRRKEEEERQVAEVRAQAEAKTEALRGQKERQRLLERIQNYLLSQQMKKAQEAAARQAQHRALDAKIERMEAEEERRYQPARASNPAFDMARWKERDYAEAARWEREQAYQAYRQGERAEPQPVAQPQKPAGLSLSKPWWQKAGDWLQQKVVQPVRQAAGTIVSAWKPPQTAGSSKLAAPAKDGPPPWWQKIANAAAQVVTKITEFSARTVSAVQDIAAKTVKKTTNWAMSFADAALDAMYGYHGPANPPKNVTGQLWMSLPGASPLSPNSILDNYRVDQLHTPIWPSNNECVTAATIQDMNMMQAILADKFGIPELVHMDLPTFATAFDAQPLWLLRPPADTPVVGGMMHPYAAVAVMQGHADWLRTNFGCGYRVELTSGNTVDDLIENLKNGYPTSLHISQKVTLFENGKFNYLALLGGMPHTVTLAGYDATTDEWRILDPAGYHDRWSTSELMDYWGRQFIGYPPRFAMTTLIPDATCTPPLSPNSTPLATPVATPPTPPGAPPATPTAQSTATSEEGVSATPVAPAIPTPPASTGTPPQK